MLNMKESKKVHMQGLAIDELTTCEDLHDFKSRWYFSVDSVFKTNEGQMLQPF